MVQRRSLLKNAASAALSAPALVGFAQQSTTLKFHTFMGPQSNVWLKMHKPWMRKVETESAGRIRFEAFPGMQLGGTAAQLFDQAKNGVVDLIWTLPSYSAGRFPLTEVFELPFMMTSTEATSRALWDYIQTHALDEYKDVHLLAAHVHGPGVICTVNKPIWGVDDLKGLKLRAPSRQVTKLLSILGATPVGMPLPSIPDALSKGAIHGAVMPWEVMPSIKAQELTKFQAEFDVSGGALYTAPFVLAMNRAKYQSLNPDLQKVIDNNAGLRTSGWLGKTQREGDEPARQAAIERGNSVFTISAEQAQEFRRKARPLEYDWVHEIIKKGYDGHKLLQSAKLLIDQHSKRA